MVRNKIRSVTRTRQSQNGPIRGKLCLVEEINFRIVKVTLCQLYSASHLIFCSIIWQFCDMGGYK